MGAQSVAAAYRGGRLDKAEAERLLAFCNNAGPAFLFGMAATMFPRRWMAWALWGIHILSALFAASVFPGRETDARLERGKPVSLPGAMTAALSVMAAVCGWVVLFRVVIAFLSRWVLWLLPMSGQVVITGLLELTNGCCSLMNIPGIPPRFAVCSGMLAFGGLCVTMQTVTVTRGLSLRNYFLGKLIQTAMSLLLSAAVFTRLWPAALGGLGIFLVISRKTRKRSSIPGAIGV